MFCWAAQADEIPAIAAKVEHQDALIKVTASMTLPVQPCEAFRLLTDYDTLPQYVPGVLETHHEYVASGVAKVWQTGDVRVWFFHIKMKSLLEIHEMPDREISFKQIEGDLKSYSGTWNLLEDAQGTAVLYKAELAFKKFTPVFMARMILEDEIKKRFAAIAKEATARKAKGLLDCVTKTGGGK